MATLFSGFGGFSGAASILIKWGGILAVFALIAFSLTAIVIMLVVKKKMTKIIEITPNKRIQFTNGRYKKKKGTEVQQFHIRKLRAKLPQFQQRDIYYKGKQDTVLLMKDNNGMYHPLRVPTWKQLKKWYSVVYDVDLEKKDNLNQQQLLMRAVYMEPSPHENLDWLSNQVVEAEREFKDLEWWQHPNVMIGISVAGAVFIQMINLVILYLMHK